MDVDTSDDEISIRDSGWCPAEHGIKKRSIINESYDEDKENQDIFNDNDQSDDSFWSKRLRKRQKSSIVEEECDVNEEDDSLTAVIRGVKLRENHVPVKITAHSTDPTDPHKSGSTRRTRRSLPSISPTDPTPHIDPTAPTPAAPTPAAPTPTAPTPTAPTPTAPASSAAPTPPTPPPTTRSLMDLPNELLQAILVRVPGRAVGQVSRVCSTFYRFYQECWVWRDLCHNELGLEVSVGEEAKKVYKHVHYHYGALQGYFMRCGVPGGGLLKVVFKNKCLVATDIQVDRFSKKSLEGHPIETDIFSIKLNNISNTSKLSRQNKISADCLLPGPRHSHKCEIFVKRFDKSKLDENAARTPQPGFSIRCPKDKFKDHTDSALKTWINKSRIIDQTFDNCDRLGFTIYQLLDKLKTALQFGFSYTTLKEQSGLPSVPEFDLRDTLIKHGLYVGDFMSDNGYQIVNLTYESFERLPYLLCRKVTSDGHVTSGLITLRAKMENIKVIDWSWRKRPTIEEVKEKDHVTYIELDDLKNRPPRKFMLPKSCGCAIKPPGKCRTVFRGEMMICDGHREWKWDWAEGYIVVFSDDLFGFLNLRVNYFHMFSKMKLDN